MKMKSYFFLVLIALCVIKVLHAGMVIATLCSEYASVYSIEVATFCANSHASGSLIVVDGYYANTISDTVCSCFVRSYKSQTFTLRTPSGNTNFIPDISSDCGSYVLVVHNDGTFRLKCAHFGSTNVTENEIITLVLTKITEPKDTRYCFILGQENASFDVSCSSQYTEVSGEVTTVSRTSPMETKEQSGEETSVSSIFFTLVTTEATLDLSSTTATYSELPFLDGDHKLYVGIGAGCALLIVLVLILMVIIYRIRYMKRLQELSTKNKLYDELGTAKDISIYSTIRTDAKEYENVSSDKF